MTLREAAHWYLNMGLHPIPCRPKAKTPLVEWKGFQDTPPTADQIDQWWTRTPEANVALVLGRGIFAVDCDGGEAAESLLRQLHGIELPSQAPKSRTGGGYHVFLTSPEPVPDRIGLVSGPTGGRPQVDIRGIGIVVAPPSIHPTGAQYQWEVPLRDDELPPFAPDNLLRLIRQQKAARTTTTNAPPAGEGWVIATLAGVPEGQRDDACTKLSGYFLRRGLDADIVEALLVESFARNCDPPFDRRSVQKCVRSISRRENVSSGDLAPVAAQPLGAVLDRLVQSLEEGPPPALPTPFPTLNWYLNRGFAPGELIFLGARPGIGKTALGLEFARCAARERHKVLIISREMTTLALARRVVAQDARIRASALKNANLNDVEAYAFQESIKRLHGLPVWLTDEAVSLGQINQLASAMDAIGLLVVDYLQLVRAPRDIKERRHQIEAVSQTLKTMALTYKMPVLCLSSLSRPGGDKRQGKMPRPTLDSLRESGELEHDADIILFLHRESYQNQETECIVAKNRDGRLGTVHLNFRSESVSFDEATDRQES